MGKNGVILYNAVYVLIIFTLSMNQLYNLHFNDISYKVYILKICLNYFPFREF